MSVNNETKNVKITKTGFLMKRSKYLGTWNRRFIVLTDNDILSYMNDQPNSECTMDLQLSECYGPKHYNTEDSEFPYGFSFANNSKIYYFKTKDKEECDNWFTQLREAMS